MRHALLLGTIYIFVTGSTTLRRSSFSSAGAQAGSEVIFDARRKGIMVWRAPSASSSLLIVFAAMALIM
jgi:hypothetical protein